MNYSENLNLKSIEYIDEDGNLKIEQWALPDKYFLKYMVSDLGRIKSLNYNNKGIEGIIKQSLSNNGYYHVRLKNKNNKLMNIKTHQMVAIGFLGHTLDRFNKVIDHKNNVKTDNRLVNLQIVTPRFNTNKDKIKEGILIGDSWYKGENIWCPSVTIDNTLYKLGNYTTLKEASNAYNKAVYDWENDKIKPFKKQRVKNCIRFFKANKKWGVRIRYEGSYYHVGYYLTEIEAIDAKVNTENNIEEFVKKHTKKVKSIHFNKVSQKWIVGMNIQKVKVALGRFITEQEAIEFLDKLNTIVSLFTKQDIALEKLLKEMFDNGLPLIQKHLKILNELNNKSSLT